jgi:hypothetical protein
MSDTKSLSSRIDDEFGDRVQVTPELTPSNREATLEFQSNVGQVRLRFSTSTDRDVRKVILGYDLEIIPVFFDYQPHAESEFPLDAVDEAAAVRWVDDRIIDFVGAYLSMSENEYYTEKHMVEDPVAHVRFPDFAAGATLQWQGRTACLWIRSSRSGLKSAFEGGSSVEVHNSVRAERLVHATLTL